LPINKTVKNIILAFTILCAFVLILFSVELIRQNRNTENAAGGGEPSVSGDTAGTNGAGASGDNDPSSPANGGEDTGGGAGGGDERPGAGGQRPAPTGTRYEAPVTLNSTLVFYVDTQLFDYVDPELEEGLFLFTFRGDGLAEIHIRFVPVPNDIKAFAGGYLTTDFEVRDTVVGDEDYIGLTQLLGVKASGAKDGSNFDVWIHRLTGAEYDDMGVAFVIIYQNNAQRDMLYDILDSMEIVRS